MKKNLTKKILDILNKNPQKKFFDIEGSKISNKNFIEKVFSKNLSLKRTIKPQTKVLLFCNNNLDFYINLITIWSLGGIAVVVDKSFDKDLQKEILSNLKIYFTIGIKIKGYKCINKNYSKKKLNLKKFYNSIYAYKKNQYCTFLFTSGTSGKPKIVPIKDFMLLENATSAKNKIKMNKNEKVFVSTPLRFISTFSHFLVTMLSSASFVTKQSQGNFSEIIKILNQKKITFFGGAPIQFIIILNYLNFIGKSLKTLMITGDNLNTSYIKEMLKKKPKMKIIIGYGLTELAGRFSLLELPKEISNLGSVGKPIKGLKVIKSSKKDSKIKVSGKTLFNDYFPSKKRIKIFDTGDIGFVNKQNYIYLTGRSDRVVKRSGLKISLKKIEEEINKNFELNDLFVFSILDKVQGSIPICIYSSKKKYLENIMKNRLRKTLESNEIPEKFIKVKNIPRTGSGKVDRRKALQSYNG